MLNIFKKLLQFFRLLPKNKSDVNYIGGGRALPSPLTADEELRLILSHQAGDKLSRDKLIEHNLRLVVYIAKKFENTGVDIEDLISIGTIGLIKSINSFNLEKEIKLATFSSRCIENEILMHLRKVVKLKAEVSLDEPLNTDWEGNVLLLSDVLGTEIDVTYRGLEKDAENEILIKCFKKLPQREGEIIQMRFGILGTEKRTQKEIADILGISQSYISRLEKKVLKKLKKEMLKMV